jgi:hypothetical protein
LKQTATGKGLGFSGTTPTVTYIKGNKMRNDTITGDTTRSIIFDLDGQKLYMFDSKKKEADVYDMTTFAEQISTNVDQANIKAAIKPNGQTKEIAGKTANGYDIEISVPASIGGSKEMSMVATMTGPTWIVKGAPGAADFGRFYKAAAEKGWIFTDPRAAKGQPGQAKAMAKMYEEMAATGGIPYQTDMQMKMGSSGSGNPLGGLFSKLGNMSFSTTVDTVETGALADDLFAPPAGYKLKPQK